MKASWSIYLIIFSLLLAGCTTTSQQTKETTTDVATTESQTTNREQLMTYKWRVLSIQDQQVSKGASGKPLSMVFDDQAKKVGGYAGCNRYFGNYSADEKNLKFSFLGMTRMACHKGMELEAKFSKMTSQVVSYSIENKQLKLFDGDGKSLAVLAAM